jgi:hypothetical protein
MVANTAVLKKYPPAARKHQTITIHRGGKPDLLIAREGAFDASAIPITNSDRRRRM